jgi:drug/metabolite transporter (DMT)-like permease
VNAGALLLPLGAGFGYACGAIAVKRAMGGGISGRWVNLACNGVMALAFQSLWFLPAPLVPVAHLSKPCLCGLLFFLGQLMTFRAIATGEVSVATPLLGTKVILVALLSVIVIGRPLPGSWWLASFLASIGIILVSWSPGAPRRHAFEAVAWSLGAAATFALTDVLVQKWVPDVGYGRFAPVMFGVMGLFSLVHFLSRGGGAGDLKARGGMPWLAAGALLLAIQAFGMYSAIGLYGSASLTNILYGSRCLWSVLLVWMFGSMAGDSAPDDVTRRVMPVRLAGATLLVGAMALVL